jgi:hypothetical protein
LRPGRSQRRFAEPCRRLDHGQSLSGELGNHVQEPWTRDQPLASRRNDLGREEFELLPVEDSALRRGWLAVGARQSRLCQWCVPIGAPPGPDPSNRASVAHYTTWTEVGKATGRLPTPHRWFHAAQARKGARLQQARRSVHHPALPRKFLVSAIDST